jgi:hypothetical protein
MRTIVTFYTILLLLGASSCGVIPVNNHFETAGTLKKGNMEMTGGISAYTNGLLKDDAASAKTISGTANIGARFGIGLSDKADIKFRYERMVYANLEDFKSMSYYSVIPKFALTANEFSLMIPMSIYRYKDSYWSAETSSTMASIAPQFLYTFTSPQKKTDLTIGVKGDLLFGDTGGALLFGGSIGAGFSKDLTKWAIRPEIGANLIGMTAIWNYGITFQYMMPRKKR